MNGYSYVYILQSEKEKMRHYTGLTDNLHERVEKHNRAEVSHTSKYRPLTLMVAIAFKERSRASEFEAYLKTHSGRIFARQHF